jgi:hypothetical protein
MLDGNVGTFYRSRTGFNLAPFIIFDLGEEAKVNRMRLHLSVLPGETRDNVPNPREIRLVLGTGATLPFTGFLDKRAVAFKDGWQTFDVYARTRFARLNLNGTPGSFLRINEVEFYANNALDDATFQPAPDVQDPDRKPVYDDCKNVDVVRDNVTDGLLLHMTFDDVVCPYRDRTGNANHAVVKVS